jgi:3-hydroxyisobutyrate dehydrogenase-like beta-hydroxyacid dehydrogenase
MFTDFKPLASALTIIVKDTLIITSEARRSGYAVPVTAAAEAAYLTALNLGYGPEDDSALLKLYTGGIGKMGPVAGTAKTDEDKVNLAICLLQGIHLCAAAECLGFAHKVGLDLDQVLDLCMNAAGGSAMLEAHGQAMIQALNGTTSTKGKELSTVFEGLRSAVDEAAGLKAPLHLGNAALNVMQIALNSTEGTAIGPVAAV